MTTTIPTIEEAVASFEVTSRRITEAELLAVQFQTEFSIHIILDPAETIPGRYATAEIVFEGGLLEGFKIEGFGIWARSRRDYRPKHQQEVTVTYPARVHRVDGQQISRAIFRAPTAEQRLAMSSVIIAAFRMAYQRES